MEGTVLVIDDDPVLRGISRDMLEECGYQSRLAENGVQGLNIYAAEHAAIIGVILDMVLPKMNCKEVFERLRTINPGVKVILTSGFKEDERIQELMDMGIMAFIPKPYNLSGFAKVITACFQDNVTD